MSKRRKNLLDAFRATGPAARSTPPSVTPLGASGHTGQAGQGSSGQVGAPSPMSPQPSVAPRSSVPPKLSSQASAPAGIPPPKTPAQQNPQQASGKPTPSASEPRATKSKPAVPTPVVVRPIPSMYEEEASDLDPESDFEPIAVASAAHAPSRTLVTEELPFLPASTTGRAPIAHATSPRTPLSRDRVVLAALAIVTVLLAVVLYVKSQQEQDVAAASQASTNTAAGNGASANPVQPQGTPPPLATQPTNSSSAPALVPGATEDDRAFYVLTNKFTVRLAQYDNDANGKKFAFEAYKYLRTEGGPVVQPIVSGDGAHIFLCAGAAPKKDDLAEITAWCVKLRGPSSSKKPPFAGAYIDNIDHVLKRN